MACPSLQNGMDRPSRSPLAVHWGLDPETVFLNHGSFGATPTAIREEQRRWQDRMEHEPVAFLDGEGCLLYTSPSPRDRQKSRMPSSA